MRQLALPVLFLALSAPVGAQMYGADYEECNQQSTADIVDCLNASAKTWDRRLNGAYKALMSRSDPGQKEPLKAAQRLWVQYRDANCRFYAAGEGSISQIAAAECLRAMTQQRACEMEAANMQEGAVGQGCE